MGKQQKIKAQRRAERNATIVPCQSWQDEEGIHIITPGEPSSGLMEQLTENFQKQVRNSPLWLQMVAEFGEGKALELLKQFRVDIKE